MSESTAADPMTVMAIVGAAQGAKPQGFEGPEKRLEIIVRGKGLDDGGLRQAAQEEWAAIIAILKAQIVNKVHNEHLDAYVLTESSLFVFPNKVLLITCGTTILLHALPAILDVIAKYHLEVEWASFMRKNFSYPWEQIGPHASMESEYALLKAHLPLGKPFIFGPIDSDHYFCFVYDDIHRPCVEEETQISMTMYDFDPKVAAHFYSDKFMDGEATTPIRAATGVETLVPGWIVQDLQFAPCGYSINAIKDGLYQTMHITPEEHCSFASYETNTPTADVAEVLTGVLAVFKPQRFTVVLLADPQSPIGVKLERSEDLGWDNVAGYTVSNMSVNEFAPGYTLVKANFTRDSA
jgi:S-adenosylmethionine decarboxylase